MNSCIYAGTVRHTRRTPVVHDFTRRLFMLLVDLDEVDQLFARRWLWSATRPAPARFDRRDYPGDPATPLADWVRDLVEQRAGERPGGPVRLLTHLRWWGKWFNPISIYYCYAEDAVTLRFAVAEVTNTPWRERTHYVLDARDGARVHRGAMEKDLHVSPFLPMDMRYEWRLTAPGRALGAHFDVLRDGQVVLDVGLAMRRRPLTRASMARLLVSHPPMSWAVLAGIYGNAFRLWRKGVPYHPRPSRDAAERVAA